MLKIAMLDTVTLGDDIDISIFQKFGDLKVYETTSEEQTYERIKDRDIVITNKVPLKTILNKLENLKLICLTATGTNNVDLNLAKEKNIAVTNVAGYSTSSVVQHTFAMLFYLVEKLQYFDNYVKSGEYCKSKHFTHFGRKFFEIEGKTWGIVGLGEIGRNVAKIASSFGCKIVYYSTSGKNNTNDYRSVEKEELLRASDIISIHAPLNANTKDLFAYQDFEKMKNSSILLNLGRGGIVNEKDLVKALRENKISGAALDVLEKEPMENDSELLKAIEHEKLFITPHIAWASVEARKRLIEEIKLNIEAFLKGENRNRVC